MSARCRASCAITRLHYTLVTKHVSVTTPVCRIAVALHNACVEFGGTDSIAPQRKHREPVAAPRLWLRARIEQKSVAANLPYGHPDRALNRSHGWVRPTLRLVCADQARAAPEGPYGVAVSSEAT